MTPFEAFENDQQRIEKQEAAANDRYFDGATDAGLGDPPQYTDARYLAGYIATVQQLPTDADGKVIHSSPHKKFAFGWVDGSERFSEEF